VASSAACCTKCSDSSTCMGYLFDMTPNYGSDLTYRCFLFSSLPSTYTEDASQDGEYLIKSPPTDVPLAAPTDAPTDAPFQLLPPTHPLSAVRV
jgi:hypothetical protein